MTESPPRAIQVLLDEHTLGREYLDPLEELPDSVASFSGEATRSLVEVVLRALGYLDDQLEEHIEKEEEALFPPMQQRLPAVESVLIEEFLAEHDQIRIHRDDLEETLADLLTAHDDIREDRAALDTAIREFLASGTPDLYSSVSRQARRITAIAMIHFENEENLLFPLAPGLLPEDELARIAAQMDDIATRFRQARLP